MICENGFPEVTGNLANRLFITGVLLDGSGSTYSVVAIFSVVVGTVVGIGVVVGEVCTV